MAQLTGITQDGTEVPVQVKPDGRLVAEGLDGPPGPTGPAGPAGDAQFSASSSESVYLPSPKKLGLGTSSPVLPFHVEASTDGPQTLAYLVNASTGGTNETAALAFGLKGTAGTGACRIVAGKDSDFSSAANVDSFLAFNTTLNDTEGERVRITSAGNVGIGTTSPQATVDITGSGECLRIQSTKASTNYITHKHNSSGDIAYLGAAGGAALGSGAATDYAIRANQGALLFATNGNNERARITSDGKLLVGTVNHPQSAVRGSVVCAGGLYLSSPNGSWWQIGVSDTGTLSAVAA